uniref:Metallo-beta-lactamase family protein n=1 Tax=Solanum tuberosum TaxID=4113 RepID=M0ZR88_SOLTU
MAVFLGIVRPPSHSLFSITRFTRQFSFTNNNSISISRKSFSRFKPIVTASLHSSSANSQNGAEVSANQSELMFLGTGTSEGIPRVSCLTNPLKTCPVCSKAAEPGSRNRRLNTSILIRHSRPSGNRNFLIDVGKFFYHSAMQWFPAYGIRTIDAVIITHSHADAIGGL